MRQIFQIAYDKITSLYWERFMQRKKWLGFILIIAMLVLFFPVATQGQCRDSDNDRICDDKDSCPNDRSNTCNQDTDGDGISDNQDQCPDTRGISSNNGCPAPDRDGDGTADGQDQCPDTGGPTWNAGCPEGENTPPQTSNDGDGDGVADG